MGNLAIAFDPKSGTIGSRLRAEQNVSSLDQTLCLLVRGGGVPQAETACALFKALLKPFVDADPLNNASARLAGETSPGATSVRYGGARSARDLSGLMGSAG
jgi:hypothetical protein